jgi:hypothetical protein
VTDQPQALFGSIGSNKPSQLELALERALIEIANYSPASTIQPVAIARDALKKLGIDYMQRDCAAPPATQGDTK